MHEQGVPAAKSFRRLPRPTCEEDVTSKLACYCQDSKQFMHCSSETNISTYAVITTAPCPTTTHSSAELPSHKSTVTKTCARLRGDHVLMCFTFEHRIDTDNCTPTHTCCANPYVSHCSDTASLVQPRCLRSIAQFLQLEPVLGNELLICQDMAAFGTFYGLGLGATTHRNATECGMQATRQFLPSLETSLAANRIILIVASFACGDWAARTLLGCLWVVKSRL